MINDGRVIFFFCCAIEGVASAAASAAARSKRIKTVLCDDIYKNDQVITLYQIFGLFASPRRDRWWECAHRSTDSAESSSLIIFVSFKKETSCHTHNRQSLFCLNSRKEKRERHTHTHTQMTWRIARIVRERGRYCVNACYMGCTPLPCP